MFSAVDVFVQGKQRFTLVDTKGTLTYVNEKTAQSLHLSVQPLTRTVSMTVRSLHESVLGGCVTELTLNGIRYQNVTLQVTKNLRDDAFLGQDFQRQHECVVFMYDGTKQGTGGAIPAMTNLCGGSSNCAIFSTVQLSYVNF